MNAEVKVEAAPATAIPETAANTTDIVSFVERHPAVVFTDKDAFNRFYERVKEETDRLVPDVSTKKGRDEIRAMASKVTKTKTHLDAARKQLTEEWRKLTATVNEAGKEIEASLKKLADDVRRPLTEWEDKEAERVRECEKIVEFIRAAAIISLEDTSASVQARGMEVWAIQISEQQFKDLFDVAVEAKNSAVATLKQAMDRLKQEEADKAELEKLRAEKAEREAREQQEREARARQEREAEAARIEQERQEAAARAEQERVDAAAREAEERARREAEAEAQRKIDEANERARRAEAEAEAERIRIRDEENRRKAEEERLAEEQRAREADANHRANVVNEAKAALIKHGGITAKAAHAIILAIMAGEVPSIRMHL